MNARTMVVLAALGLALVAPGCKSSKEVAADVATQSVREFQDKLAVMPKDLDAASATLLQLTAATNGNRAATLATFNQQLAGLRNQGGRLAHASDDANADSDRFFREWLRESRGIKDESARTQALTALSSHKDQVRQAQSYLSEGAKQYKTMLTRMDEIQTTIAADLTKATTPQVQNKVGPAIDAATGAKSKIERLSEQIDTILTKK